MEISYHPEDDYLHVRLARAGEAKGDVAGEDVASGVVLLTDDEGRAIELEVDSASKRLDLSRLEVEGLPASVAAPERPESKAS